MTLSLGLIFSQCSSLILWRFLWVLPVVSVVAFQSITLVPRIPISEFRYYDHYQGKQPLIIETGLPVESLCDNLMNQVASSTITLQQKTPQTTNLLECTVDQAIDLMMVRSNHNQSLFAFCEGLLDGIADAKQFTGKQVFLEKNKDRFDWFDLFPEQFQPSDCVILAGEGATSTLHRDPFEWTGTSLCLEGTKLWRFIAPNIQDSIDSSVEDIDEMLKAYRLPSVAWDDAGSDTCLSAGWQSEYSLYSERDDSVPVARSLSEKEDSKRINVLEKVAMDWPLLNPNLDTNSLSCWTVIQKPGDLLLIPAHWWHQTYALEPSLAVASQRCDSDIDASKVLGHILETTDTRETAPDVLCQASYSGKMQRKEVENIIATLFRHLHESI